MIGSCFLGKKLLDITLDNTLDITLDITLDNTLLYQTG